MAKPAGGPVTWATDPNYTSGDETGMSTRLEPSAGIKAQGWKPKQEAPARWMNWILGKLADWTAYLNNLHADPDFLNNDFAFGGNVSVAKDLSVTEDLSVTKNAVVIGLLEASDISSQGDLSVLQSGTFANGKVILGPDASLNLPYPNSSAFINGMVTVENLDASNAVIASNFISSAGYITINSANGWYRFNGSRTASYMVPAARVHYCREQGVSPQDYGLHVYGAPSSVTIWGPASSTFRLPLGSIPAGSTLTKVDLYCAKVGGGTIYTATLRRMRSTGTTMNETTLGIPQSLSGFSAMSYPVFAGTQVLDQHDSLDIELLAGASQGSVSDNLTLYKAVVEYTAPRQTYHMNVT